MPLPLPTNVWDRSRWQQERDKLKVPKGAVSKVSIGDSIDKFHKSRKQGPKQGRAAAQSLQKDLAIYKKAILAKHKPFVDRIENQLDFNVSAYLTDVDKLARVAQEYPARHQAAIVEVTQLGAEFIAWEKAGSLGSFTPSNKKAAEKALTGFVGVAKKAPYQTDKVTLDQAKKLDQVVYAMTGGAWSSKTVNPLMTMMPKFPGAV